MKPDLSDREIEILARVSYGQTSGQIGRALNITETTVKTHLRRMFAKVQVADRSALVRAGFERGYLHLSVPEDPEPSIVVDATPVALDWVAVELARQAQQFAGPEDVPRPLGDRHIGACFAARACPCREGSTWRFPEEAAR